MLATYFETEGRGAATKLALAIGAHHPDVSDWAKGSRPVPVRYVLKIEAATGGRVTRQELRPNDWQDYWPIKTRRAPRQVAGVPHVA